MRKGKKIAVILSVLCILIGFGLMLGAWMGLQGTDFTSLNTLQFEKAEHIITQSFDVIDIQTTDSSIQIIPASDGTCRVVCDDNEARYHELSVENHTLTISQKDDMKWYETLGIVWYYDPVVTVYLPEAEYEALVLNTLSGNIEIPEGFSFQTAGVQTTSGSITFSSTVDEYLTVSSTSGDVLLHAPKAEYLKLKTVSGDIRLTDFSAETVEATTSSGLLELLNGKTWSNITLETTSGDITLDSVELNTLGISTSSGDTSLEHVAARGEFYLKSVSGDIFLSHSDAAALQIKTTSGDVEGTLLSPKNFVTKTSSGYVGVPASDPDRGVCEITTTSGNINIQSVEPRTRIMEENSENLLGGK